MRVNIELTVCRLGQMQYICDWLVVVGVPALVGYMNVFRSSLAVSCNSIHRAQSPTEDCECSQTIDCSVRDGHPDESYSFLLLTNKQGANCVRLSNKVNESTVYGRAYTC